MSAFRNRLTGAWDRQFLRTCIVYRAFTRGWVTQAEAVKLALRPFRRGKPMDISATIEMWAKNPRKEFSS